MLPDGLNWLCYFAGSSKNHHENSISFIFLESPHQVDMKNVVKSSKHFFGYFNTLETHSEILNKCTVSWFDYRIADDFNRQNQMIISTIFNTPFVSMWHVKSCTQCYWDCWFWINSERFFFSFLRATQANPGAKNEYLSDVKMF